MKKVFSKHKPVLIKEVLKEFEDLQKNSDKSLFIIDCTLGQAGHSFELFEKLDKGVLLSIDLNFESIEWTAKTYGLEPHKELENCFQIVEGEKTWIIIQEDFLNLENILKTFNVEKFDYLLADLGFSNFELTQNLGISYSAPGQRLDMRYGTEGLTASEIVNQFTAAQIKDILIFHGDIEDQFAKVISSKIVSHRDDHPFERVRDLTYIVRKYPPSIKVKLFQALRSYTNDEPLKLHRLGQFITQYQNENGISVIITFNPLEEKILNQLLGEHKTVDPNITEIISNQQSRSAKLHIFKTKSNNQQP
jgi:16S rRNA (cytosine1402-N4)-methyltransferase